MFDEKYRNHFFLVALLCLSLALALAADTLADPPATPKTPASPATPKTPKTPKTLETPARARCAKCGAEQ